MKHTHARTHLGPEGRTQKKNEANAQKVIVIGVKLKNDEEIKMNETDRKTHRIFASLKNNLKPSQ